MMKIFKQTGLLLFFSSLAALSATSANATPYTVGDIFASVSNGQVKHYSAAGVLLETLNTGVGGFTTGSAFDSAGNFYVTNFSSASVSKFAGPTDPHTTTLFGSGYGNSPESIVFASNGDVLVGSVGGGIRELTSTGAFVKTIATGTRVDWFDLAADQTTILFTQEGSAIKKADRNTGLVSATNFATGIGDFALRFLSDGTVLVANDADVKHLSATGALLSTYDVTGVDSFFALNLDPDGTSFLTGSFANGDLYRFDIASGALLQTINTLSGASALFGVSVYGEITAATPPPPTTGVPEPSALALLAVGSLALGLRRRCNK